MASTDARLKIGLIGSQGPEADGWLWAITAEAGVDLYCASTVGAQAERLAAMAGGDSHATVAQLLAPVPDAIVVAVPEQDRYETALRLVSDPRAASLHSVLVVGDRLTAEPATDAELIRVATERGVALAQPFAQPLMLRWAIDAARSDAFLLPDRIEYEGVMREKWASVLRTYGPQALTALCALIPDERIDTVRAWDGGGNCRIVLCADEMELELTINAGVKHAIDDHAVKLSVLGHHELKAGFNTSTGDAARSPGFIAAEDLLDAVVHEWLMRVRERRALPVTNADMLRVLGVHAAALESSASGDAVAPLTPDQILRGS